MQFIILFITITYGILFVIDLIFKSIRYYKLLSIGESTVWLVLRAGILGMFITAYVLMFHK
jgi:hypothetical protein